MEQVGHVYFFGMEGLPYVKIGVTKDVRKRFKQFSTLAHSKPVIIGSVLSFNCWGLEKHFHKKLLHLKRRGEFFKISQQEAEKIIEEYQALDKQYGSMIPNYFLHDKERLPALLEKIMNELKEKG